MKNKEFEYSFKVTSLDPFFNYCKENGYKEIEKNKQTRILYKKQDKTMARLTIKETKDGIKKELDFKQDLTTNDVLTERKESMAIPYEDDEAVLSIIEFLGYKKDIVLCRIRSVLQKENVKFEIDDYLSPEQIYVVAIEGEEKESTNVYQEIKNKYIDYFLTENNN